MFCYSSIGPINNFVSYATYNMYMYMYMYMNMSVYSRTLCRALFATLQRH